MAQFSTKPWQNDSVGATKLNAAAFIDLERRVTRRTLMGPFGEPVTTYYSRLFSSALSSGVTNFASNIQQRHKLAKAQGSVRLYYRNGFFDTDNTNSVDIAVQVSLGALGAGPFIPVTFNGARSKTIPGGAWVISDPVPVNLPAAGEFYSHTYTDAGASGKFVINSGSIQTGEFGNNNAGGGIGSASDQSGVQLTAGTSTGFGPSMILSGGQSPGTEDTGPVMGIFGDSVSAGRYDTSGTLGYLTRTAALQNVGYVNISKGSEQMNQFVNTVGTGWRRLSEMIGITSAFIHYGINDTTAPRTLVQMQADVPKMAAIARRFGARVVTFATIQPLTTSTDSWVTSANQTPYAQNSVRVTYNDWLRGLDAAGRASNGFDYVFDMAALVETDATGETVAVLNGGRWIANYATGTVGGGPDGIHPGPTAQANVATSLSNTLTSTPAMLGI